MLIEHFDVKFLNTSQCQLSWSSATENVWSWIFVNGKLACGPYMAETKNRSVTLPISTNGTFCVEVHDFEDETVPTAIFETPLVKPQIAWNAVESAAAYRVYHTIFDTGSIESLLVQVPPMGMERTEIDCPVKLEGRNGRWHSFRVESVDQFGNESENEVTKYFAADLPPTPELEISRDVESGNLTFCIIST